MNFLNPAIVLFLIATIVTDVESLSSNFSLSDGPMKRCRRSTDIDFSKSVWHTENLNPLSKSVELPFRSKLSLRPGQSISMFAKTNEDAKQFEINLMTNDSLVDDSSIDVVFHCKVDFYNDEIVLHFRENGEWNSTARDSYKPTIGKDQYFDLKLRVYENHFLIIINHEFIYSYFASLSYKKVRNIEIRGDIRIDMLDLGEEYIKLPFISIFNNGLLQDKNGLKIYGRPYGRFDVYLYGSEKNVNFYINVRFDENKVVLNKWLGEWGDELIDTLQPFELRKKFQLDLRVTRDAVLVYVDGIEKKGLQRRKDDELIMLMIKGDLELHGIEQYTLK